MRRKKEIARNVNMGSYDALLADVSGLLEEVRHTAARAINSIMTAT